jgi:hypothetical protein
VQHPLWCRYAPTFHFHLTLPHMLGATLRGAQVVQVGEPREKRLLAATGMMVQPGASVPSSWVWGGQTAPELGRILTMLL